MFLEGECGEVVQGQEWACKKCRVQKTSWRAPNTQQLESRGRKTAGETNHLNITQGRVLKQPLRLFKPFRYRLYVKLHALTILASRVACRQELRYRPSVSRRHVTGMWSVRYRDRENPTISRLGTSNNHQNLTSSLGLLAFSNPQNHNYSSNWSWLIVQGHHLWPLEPLANQYFEHPQFNITSAAFEFRHVECQIWHQFSARKLCHVSNFDHEFSTYRTSQPY